MKGSVIGALARVLKERNYFAEEDLQQRRNFWIRRGGDFCHGHSFGGSSQKEPVTRDHR